MKPKSKDHILEKFEIEELKAKCLSDYERMVIYGLIYTGMRNSEFLHIERNWIDFNNGIISIPQYMVCPCYECKKEFRTKKGNVKKPTGVWKPKTKDGVRGVRILTPLMPFFKRYFQNHNSILETYGNRVEIWRILKRVYKRTKIQKQVFPHSIRATYATMAAERIDNPMDLKDIMGWKNLNVAESYVKMSKERMKKMTDKLEGAW